MHRNAGRTLLASQIRKFIGCALLALAASPAACQIQDPRLPNVALFGGMGITNANPSNAVHSSMQFGADLDQSAAWSRSHPMFPVGYLFEGGYISPANSFSAGSAILSLNYLGRFNFSDRPDPGVMTFLTGGYTRLFGTGNAINFGGGLEFKITDLTRIRVELRDYRHSGPAEHNFAIRIALVKTLPD
ncbi:MAG TPA: hypothetical protein VFP59_00570 [Candidatus Angelobacter sp.]|nr:hypothetical protein [Candidatus Angelobacter sp.]